MLKIRDATLSDLNECANLSRVEELRTPEGDYPTLKYLREFLNKGLFLVAEEDFLTVGYLAGEMLSGNVVYLNCVVVNSKKRGQGVGTMLLAEFSKRIKKRKIAMVFFFVPKSNPRSIRFYQKNGFVRGKEHIFFCKGV